MHLIQNKVGKKTQNGTAWIGQIEEKYQGSKFKSNHINDYNKYKWTKY